MGQLMRLLFAIAVLSHGSLAWAQMNAGEISGGVQDQSGSVLAGAIVQAQLAETGQAFKALSNRAGEYLLAQLPVGSYSLSVSATNFKVSTLPRIELHAGDRLRRDFTLEVGDRTEMVTVLGDADSVPLEPADIRDVIRRRQLTELPVKSRQFLDLAMLSPGVVRPPGGTRGDAMQQAGTLVNVLGQRSGHNLYLLDGVAITDEHFNNMVIAPSMSAIEEVNIEKTSYAPEFGGKSGAVINVLTKFGSNNFHGSLFEFIRNDVFDAKNFFDAAAAPIPPFRQNQFGGSLGGPVRRSKTFFFASYEGQRIRKSLTQTFSVPTAAMREGNFAGAPSIYDPTAIAGGQRQPFEQNRVPMDRLDPVAISLLARIPLPNLPGTAQNLRSTGNQRINGNQYSARLDHQFSARDNTYWRTSLFDARQADPFGSGLLQESLLPGFGRGLSTPSTASRVGRIHLVRRS